MDLVFLLVIACIATGIYQAGKRSGSRKGFAAGRWRGRPRNKREDQR